MRNRILFFSFLMLFISSSANGKIKIVFRYDDYQLIPSSFSDTLLTIFQRNKIPVCLGIIPFDSAGIFIDKLDKIQVEEFKARIQREEIEIAIHGFNHINGFHRPSMGKTFYSEFAEVPFDKQYMMVASGKKALDSLLQINTNIFIPPFNTYDKNTLKALEELDFRVISASTRGAYLNNGLQYIPGTFEDFSELPEIIRKYQNENVTIILYFHPYSFKEYPIKQPNYPGNQVSIGSLNSLLKWLNEQNISCYTFSDLIQTENFNYVHYQANSLKYNFLKKILNKYKLYSYGVYLPMEFHKRHKELLFGNILLHLICFIVVYLFTGYFVKTLRPNRKAAILILSVVAGLAFFYFYYHRNDYSFWITLVMFSVIFLAVIMGLLRSFKLISRSNIQSRKVNAPDLNT